MAYYGYKPAEQAIQIGDNTIVSADIADGSIVNADLNSSAAIAMSKTQLVAGTGITLATNTLNVDAAQTQITSVGTIGTGVWNGTAIASAYLDADTAHLSTTQTFSGDKTFSGETTFSGFLNDTKIYNHLKFVNSDGTTVNGGIRGAGNSVEIRTGASTTVACTFDGSQDATFAGSVIGQNLKLYDSTVFSGGIFREETITGAGSSRDVCLFAEGATDGGAIHFMTGGSVTKVLTLDANNDATFSGQIINTGNCSFRNGEILMANDRFDVLGGQDRRITLGTIGTPGQNSSHNVRGRSDGLFLNAPSKIVGEIDGSAKWEMTSSSTSFNNQLNINDDAFTFGDDKAKVYNFTFHNDSGFTSATEYMRIVNSTGNWVWCLVEVTAIAGFGSSAHYGKKKREYFVRTLGDNGSNSVVVHEATLGTDQDASEGAISLTTILGTNNTIIFNVTTSGSRRCSVFTKVYASNNQYLTITGQ